MLLSRDHNSSIHVHSDYTLLFFPDPINTFHGSYKTDNEPIRISYHRNVHYNAVIDPYKQTVGVGLGLPLNNFQPGVSFKLAFKLIIPISMMIFVMSMWHAIMHIVL